MDTKRTVTTLGILGLVMALVTVSRDLTRKDNVRSVPGMVPATAGAPTEESVRPDLNFGEITTTSSERTIGSLAVAETDDSDPWQVGGHVRYGMQGAFADAPLIVRVFSGTHAEGEIVSEAHILTDQNGDFSWTTSDPARTVTVVVTPDAEGHKVYADTVTVPEGDAPPGNLQPFAYALDARVEGRVIDPTGEAISGARVIAHLAEALTDDDGAYTLPMASDYRSFSILAVAAGFTEGGMALGAVRPGAHSAPDLVLRKDYSVQGRVVDSEGTPLPGVAVCTYPCDRNQTLTDEEGRFRLGGLDPKKDRTRISASMDGYCSASAKVSPNSEDPEPELVLIRSARIAGRVITESGLPVKNAQVSIGTPYPRADKAVYSDESGTFSLEAARWGPITVWALRPDSAPGQSAIKLENGGEPLNGIEIVMRPGSAVTGIVLDEDDSPIVGVRVDPASAGHINRYTYVGGGAITDREGGFELNGLAEERVALHVEAPGCSPFVQVITTGAPVILRPQRAGSLAGRVISGETGEPIHSFTVRLVKPPVTSVGSKFWDISYDWRGAGMSFDDPDGAWSTGAERLVIGFELGVEISASGFAPNIVERVAVTSDPEPDDLVIELKAGATLQGFVTDAQTGAPISGARLRRFTNGSSSGNRQFQPDAGCVAYTDEEGQFEMEGVPFGSMYLIIDQTDLPVYIDGPLEVSTDAVDRAIAVTSGGRLQGRYLDGDGQPLANQTVSIYAQEGTADERPKYRATTDAKGSFEFAGLVAGPHHLRGFVKAEGSSVPVGMGVTQTVQIKDGKTVRIDLRPTGRSTLTGTLEFEGELPDLLSVDLRREQESDETPFRMLTTSVRDGVFTATHLDPGEWRAQIFYQDEDGQVFSGGANIQLPTKGAAEVLITIRPLKFRRPDANPHE